ncbi:uncharacterized protein BX663DRAFT_551687 [Cokeromyces recurvatus]|uniref:uncharacterized protein n=1 Tax=Cokeromyces recurvatus TaxID=90255 RepID=UPI00221F3628|nr:uncharacterized protein BX663DRAFT_551687 [Cokeromyces recurvatus]KAI7903418.1 hypothetical protein BX663DRAFT_551687 [Cokeromyces recurvatus]
MYSTISQPSSTLIPPSSSYQVQRNGHQNHFKPSNYSDNSDMSPNAIFIQYPSLITNNHQGIIKTKDKSSRIPFEPLANEQNKLLNLPSSLFMHSPRFVNINNTSKPMIPTKRAAQNRAAQRAFRQRKERHIKELEEKVKRMDEWKVEIEQLRQKNKELERQVHKQHQQLYHQQLLQQSYYQQHYHHHKQQYKPLTPKGRYKVAVSDTTTKDQTQVSKKLIRKLKVKHQHSLINEKEQFLFHNAHDNIDSLFMLVNMRSPEYQQKENNVINDNLSVAAAAAAATTTTNTTTTSSYLPSPLTFSSIDFDKSNTQSQEQIIWPSEMILDASDINLDPILS